MTILPNGIAVLPDDTHISKWVQQAGRLDHDQNMLPLLVDHIPMGSTVVDVGAFIGDHTEFYARRAATVAAIEPNPEAFEALAHNMQRHPHVMCMHCGVSDRFGTMGIAHNPNAGASHGTTTGDIAVITIDSLNLKRCDFIKMDCEGMEPLALMGADATLARCRPTLLIEVNRGALAQQGFAPEDIYRPLLHHGYTMRNIYPGQPLSGEQFDILCTP